MKKYFSSTTASGQAQLDDNTSILFCSKKETLYKYYRGTVQYGYTLKGDKRYSGTGLVYAIPTQEETLIFLGTKSLSPIRICCNTCEPLQWHGPSSSVGLGTYFCISVENVDKNIADIIDVYFFTKDIPSDYKSGVEVFNEKGVKIFSSNAKIFKLLDFYAEQHGNLVDASKWASFNQMTEKIYSYPSKNIAFSCGQSCFGGGGESQGSCYFSVFELTKNSLKNKFANNWDTFPLDNGGSNGYVGTDFGKSAHCATRVPFTMFTLADVTNI